MRLRNPVEQLLRDLHLQAPVRVRRRKALSRLWPAVRIGHIGFDIIDGRAVHQVRPQHTEHWTLRSVPFHPVQLDAGQANGIGPKRGSSCKHPHADIPSQPRRTNGGRPALPPVLRELPDQPQVGKTVNPPQCLRIAELRFKDHLGLQFCHQSRLAGNAELGRKVRTNVGNRLHDTRLLKKSARPSPGRAGLVLSWDYTTAFAIFPA